MVYTTEAWDILPRVFLQEFLIWQSYGALISKLRKLGFVKLQLLTMTTNS